MRFADIDHRATALRLFFVCIEIQLETGMMRTKPAWKANIY